MSLNLSLSVAISFFREEWVERQGRKLKRAQVVEIRIRREQQQEGKDRKGGGQREQQQSKSECKTGLHHTNNH